MDHRGAGPVSHLGHGLAGHAHRCVYVEVEGAQPVLIAAFQHCARADTAADIVDQNIEAAQVPDAGFNGPGGVLRPAYIGLNRSYLYAECADLRGGIIKFFGAARHYGHVGPFPSETQRRAQADAFAAAGNQGHLACEEVVSEDALEWHGHLAWT